MKNKVRKITALLVSIFMLASCGTDVPPQTEEPVASLQTETEPSWSTSQNPDSYETSAPVRSLPENLVVTSAAAESMNGKLVRTDSSFRIKTAEDLEAQELCSLLSSQPEMELSITKNSSCDYTLSCGTLPKGEIVKLLLGDGNGNTVYSWAFQTEDDFRAVSTFPADKSKYASISSGVEVKFTYPVDMNKAKDYFEISPAVSGKLVSYSSTLVFVPNNELEGGTVYTVTVKKGMPSENGDKLAEDVVFSFLTAQGNEDTYCYAMNGVSETYLPEDPVVIDISHSWEFINELNTPEFDFKLYDYRGLDGYRKALSDFINSDQWDSEYEFPTDGLALVYEGKEKLYHSEKQTNRHKSAFMLPETLAEGWYLADFRTELDGKEYRIQRLIQINPISVYAATISRQAMLFVNDTTTGNAAADAEITFTADKKDYKAKTDANGTALLDYSADESGYGLLEVRYNNNVFCDRIQCVENSELTAEQKYYTYLYTDRSAYLPNDTINVWGVIRSRKTDIDIPDNLTLRLGEGETDGITVPVTVSEDGTFTASFKIENYAETWWEEICLMDGEDVLHSISVMIRDYEKPIYIIEPVVTDFVKLPEDEPFKVGVYVTYYDGTPAVGKEVEIENRTVITDENGYAELEYKSDFDLDDAAYSACSSSYIYFGITGKENQYDSAYARFFAFTRDVDIDCKTAYNDDRTSSVYLEAFDVDMSKAKLGESDDYGYTYIDDESYRGDPADLTISAELIHFWYEKVEDGTYYDFVQKKNIASYKYVHRDDTVGTYTVDVRNGKASLENLPTTEKGGYYLELSWNDKAGRKMKRSVYLRSGSWLQETDHLSYSINKRIDGDVKHTAAVGEEKEYVLSENAFEVLENEFKGRIFYAVYQDKVLLTGVSDKNSFEIRMLEEYIPNAEIAAAYFDGKHIYDAGLSSIYFETSERNIDIAIKTDRESYAPSDTASVTLKLTDKEGRAVPNARVLLSVVDEAAFAISENIAVPLSTLYRWIYYQDARTFASYIQHNMYDPLDNDGAKGGGGDSVRKKFLDTAYFAEGVSDASGNLTLPVELPDNITSWRLTAAAVGEHDGGRLYAGAAKINVHVTLPVFINTIMLSEYVEGDEVTFAASCAGAKDAVMTAEVNGESYSRKLSAVDGEFSFGKLPLGQYTVLFRAESENGNDAVELPFSVVKSRLTAGVKRSFYLNSKKIEITPEAWPVTVMFYNKDAELYSEIISRLTYLGGSNLNSRVARKYAETELGFGDKEGLMSEIKSETSDQGAKLYGYAEADPELTALMCAAFPDYVNKTKTADYFYGLLNSAEEITDDERASCYMGLAALGEPVLAETVSVLEKGEKLPYDAKLKLCAGLALLGDSSGSLKYYEPLTEKIKLYYKNEKLYAYVGESSGSDAIQGSTRLALITAAALGLPEAEGMARFLNEEKHREYGCALERIVFLRYYKPSITLDAKVSFNLDGKTVTEEINSFYGAYHRFGENQFKNADFKVLNGNVGCLVMYEGKADELEGDKTVTVTKTITLEEGEEGKPNSVYRVDLHLSNSSGANSFTIKDIVPSGARFMYGVNESNITDYVSFDYDDGQDVTVYMNGYTSATYYICRVVSGESVVEGAIALSGDSYGIADAGVF